MIEILAGPKFENLEVISFSFIILLVAWRQQVGSLSLEYHIPGSVGGSHSDPLGLTDSLLRRPASRLGKLQVSSRHSDRRTVLVNILTTSLCCPLSLVMSKQGMPKRSLSVRRVTVRVCD